MSINTLLNTLYKPHTESLHNASVSVIQNDARGC